MTEQELIKAIKDNMNTTKAMIQDLQNQINILNQRIKKI